MADKVKEGKLAQRFMTKGELVGYASSKEVARTKNVSYAVLFLLVVAGIYGFVKVAWLAPIAVCLFCVYLIIWQIWCSVKGCKFWKSIKEKAEPINLDKE